MPIKILSVDDEPDLELLLKQHFRKKIRAGQYEILFASSGLEALEKLYSDKTIDIVLTDINMPGIDGLELLEKINVMNRPSLKTVVVSAYSDMENIRTAMNRGAFDFITKPIDLDDLELTIEKTIRQTEISKKSIRDRKQLMEIQQELDLARKLQFSLLPDKYPPFPGVSDVDIFGAMKPALNVGGDLFDYFFIDDDHLGFFIGDISGKGVPAALFMAMSRSIIRSNAMRGLNPGKCMEESNRQILDAGKDSMFITLFYGILNIKNGNLAYCSAGHELPYLVPTCGGVSRLNSTGNAALGAMENVNYNTAEIPLNRGETIFMYTDGLIEALNDDEDAYGRGNLESALEKNIDQPVKKITEIVFSDVDQFTGGAAQFDDITLVALRYNTR